MKRDKKKKKREVGESNEKTDKEEGKVKRQRGEVM